MAGDNVEIISDCDGLANPHPDGEVVATIRAGSVLMVLEDFNREYLRVAFGGRPVYVAKASTAPAPASAVIETGEPANAEPARTPGPIAAGRRACPSCGYDTAQADINCPNCGQKLVFEYAGFGRRLVGYIIDNVVVSIPTYALVFIIMAAFISASPGDSARTQAELDENEAAERNGVLVAMVVVVPLSIGYYVVLNATGGTVGKRVVGIRLEDIHTGRNIGFGRSFVRLVASVFSGLVLYVGYLWCLWDDDAQTWHDKAAGSIAVIR